jgi:hypothetical protein
MIIALLTVGAIAALGSAIFDAVVLHWHLQDRKQAKADQAEIARLAVQLSHDEDLLSRIKSGEAKNDHSDYLVRTAIQEAINRGD